MSLMSLTEESAIKLRSRLMIEEGIRLDWYKDTEGYWTGGVGHKATKSDNITIPKNKDQWLEILDNDIKNILIGLKVFVYRDAFFSLSQNRKIVIADMAYQMGIKGLTRFEKMWAAIKFKDFKKSGGEMKDSDWYLKYTNRGEQLRQIMITDVYEEANKKLELI